MNFSSELFTSQKNPLHRREILRWIMHDAEAINKPIRDILNLAFKDPDWEVRATAILACVKFNEASFIPLIQKLELPKSTNSGLDKEGLNILVGIRNVAIDLLQGTPVPEEPASLDTPADKKQYLTRIVGGHTVKKMHNALLLAASLKSPAYPNKKIPKSPPAITYKANDYRIGDIKLSPIPDYTAFVGHSSIPYHPVKLSQLKLGTYFSKLPITKAQFFGSNEGHDAVKCTLEEAQAFCQKLMDQTGLRIGLPNHESWEVAVRGHNGRVHPWGNAYDKKQFYHPNMWDLYQAVGFGGEWTSSTINNGHSIIMGADKGLHCAIMHFAPPTDKFAFRIVVDGSNMLKGDAS